MGGIFSRKPKRARVFIPPPPPPAPPPPRVPSGRIKPQPSTPPLLPPPPTQEEIIRSARTRLGLDAINNYNFAFVGQTGVGKSSLINGLRAVRDNQPGSAKVGEVETTMVISKYSFPEHPHVVLWDIPGAGTRLFPEATYFEDNMLYAFDCLLILSGDCFGSFDFQLAEKAIKYKTPCAFVRTKADISLKSLASRTGNPMAQAAPLLRQSVNSSFLQAMQKVPAVMALRDSYKLFIVSAWAFDKRKQPYAFYDDELGRVDKSLTSMDEELLTNFIANSIRQRA